MSNWTREKCHTEFPVGLAVYCVPPDDPEDDRPWPCGEAGIVIGHHSGPQIYVAWVCRYEGPDGTEWYADEEPVHPDDLRPATRAEWLRVGGFEEAAP